MGQGWGFRRIYRLGVLLFVVVALGVIIVGSIIIFTSPHSYTPGEPIRTVGGFADERDRFDEAADYVRASARGSSDFYLVDLTTEYADLSAHAYAEVQGDAVFFPQWLEPDSGGGGFMRLTAGSPEGVDMHGQACTGPVDLGDGWWACGMDDPAVAPGWSEEDAGPPAWLWIAAVILFVVGAFFEWQRRRAGGIARAVVSSWVKVPATITASNLRRLNPLEAHNEGRRLQRDGVYMVDSSEGGWNGFSAGIRYEYTLGDHTYVSDRLTVVPELTEAAATVMVSKYPVGARVDAWVNPVDVTDAVLEPERTEQKMDQGRWGIWYIYGFATVLLLAAMGVIG
jgi:hypothetical protein